MVLSLNNQNNLEKEEKSWGIMLPDFKLYYKAIVIKIVWYWHKNRHVGQWNRIKTPKNEPTLTWSVNLWQRGKIIQLGNDTVFNKWCWENWTATCKRIKLDYLLTQCTKIKSRWIKDLTVRPETIKLLEENIDGMLFDIGLSNIFLDMSPQARKTKQK